MDAEEGFCEEAATTPNHDPVYGYGIVDAAAAVTTCGGNGTTPQ